VDILKRGFIDAPGHEDTGAALSATEPEYPVSGLGILIIMKIPGNDVADITEILTAIALVRIVRDLGVPKEDVSLHLQLRYQINAAKVSPCFVRF
jgi:hypothetical protein